MSANNGHRARFQIARKRRVVLRMRMREVMLTLKNKAAADAATPAAPSKARRKTGPALEAK
jgi:hypothetical protein